MESNKDEAIKCLRVAQRHQESGDYVTAVRFCRKSISLYSTPEAVRLAEILEKDASTSVPSSSTPPDATATGAEAHASAPSTKQRGSAAAGRANGETLPEQRPEYTQEMVAVVKRVRGCRVTEYYEILALSRECGETDIKKAYRKLALQLHPDKNYAPGADEAFKMVSKAFQVLSDPQKRAVFDKHGSDPESRSAGMPDGRSAFTAASHGFDGELSPEDLFNMFFGGAGPQFAATPFGPGPGFTFSFGPGVQFASARRPRAQRAPQDNTSILKQLLPLIIIVVFSLLTSLPSILESFRTPEPTFSFVPSEYYAQERYTASRNIPYYVNPQQFSGHSIWETIPPDQRQNPRAGTSSSQLRAYENTVESSYLSALQNQCRREEDYREQRLKAQIGVFGIGTNWREVERIRGEKLASCEKLAQLIQGPQ